MPKFLYLFLLYAMSAYAMQKPKDLTDDLIQLIYANKISEVKKLLEERKLDVKSFINKLGATGSSPLDIAALEGRPDIMRLLLQFGADPNGKTKNGDTILITVIAYSINESYEDKKAMIEVLLASGVDINMPDGDGYSPLYHAVQRLYHNDCKLKHNDLELIEFLLNNGAEIPEVAPAGEWSIFDMVSRCKNEKVKNELVALFANHQKSKPKKMPEVKKQQTEEEQIKPQEKKPKSGNELMETLYTLIDSKELSKLQTFLENHKADIKSFINTKDQFGDTFLTKVITLFGASRSQKISMVKLLLDAGANIDLSDIRSMTPLHYAVRFACGAFSDASDIELIELLLNHNAQFYIKSTGFSPQTALEMVENCQNKQNGEKLKKLFERYSLSEQLVEFAKDLAVFSHVLA
ncbi:MAG: ankyrin repeat domain-containing protein [Candidatus Babeliaceae bacterium]|jgi:ankyrin repeat protein